MKVNSNDKGNNGPFYNTTGLYPIFLQRINTPEQLAGIKVVFR